MKIGIPVNLTRGYPHAHRERVDLSTRGFRPISELIEGDLVLAWDAATGKTGYYVVSDTHEHLDPELVYLTVEGEVVETTPEHPFYVVERNKWLPLEVDGGWVDAGEL